MSFTPYSGDGNSGDGSNQSRSKEQSRVLSCAPILTGLLFAGLLLVIMWYALILLPSRNVSQVSAVATSGLPTIAVPEGAPKVGSRAPDFELEDVNTGQPLRLSSLKGKPVWINFWATWCPPCKEEMPIMEKYYQDYKGRGLVIMGVDVQEQKSDVLRYITEGGYSWTFVLDKASKVTNEYYVSGLPSHYFVDKEGIIQAIVVGGLKSSTTGQFRDVTPLLEKIVR